MRMTAFMEELKENNKRDNSNYRYLNYTNLYKIFKLIRVPLLLHLYLWLGYFILVAIIYYETQIAFSKSYVLDSIIKAAIPLSFIALWIYTWLQIIRIYRRRKLLEIVRMKNLTATEK